MVFRRLRWISVAVLLLPAWAEARDPLAGRLVKENYAPAPRPKTFRLDLTQFSGAEVPEGAGEVQLSIPGIVFTGDESPAPAVTTRLSRDLSMKPGEQKTIAEIFSRLHQAETELAEVGFVLTRLSIPPQQVSPGAPLTIQITDGVIESVDASKVPEAVRDPVSRNLSALVGRKPIRKADIERALLISGDLAGLTLRSTLAPGKSHGGTSLVVDGDFRRFALKASVDNSASNAVGGRSVNLSAGVNSPTGHGEQVYVAYQGIPEQLLQPSSRMTVLATGAVVPLGESGLIFSPELLWSRIEPRTEPGVPKSANRMARASLRLNYPLIRDASTTLIATSSFDFISQNVMATGFGVALSDDSYAAARAGLEWQKQVSPATSFSASLKFSRGLGDISSVFGADTAPPTHAGARSDFSKLNASFTVSHSFGLLTARANVQAQSSFGHPLYNSEQFGIDGSDAVSPLDPGSLSVDEGGTARGELATQYAFDGPIPTFAEPYVFGAAGMGHVHRASAVEAPVVRAAGAGAGIRFAFRPPSADGQTLNLNLEVGHRWMDTMVTSENTCFNIGFGWQF